MNYTKTKSMQGQNFASNPNPISGANPNPEFSNGQNIYPNNPQSNNNYNPNTNFSSPANSQFGNPVTNYQQPIAAPLPVQNQQTYPPQNIPNPGYQTPTYNQPIAEPQPGFIQHYPAKPVTLGELKKETQETQNTTPVTLANKQNIFIKSGIILLIILLVISVICVILAVALPNTAPGNWLNGNTFLRNLNSKPSDNPNSKVNSNNSSISSATINSDQFAFQPATGSKPVIQIIEDSLPSVLSISLKSKGDNLNLTQDLSAGTGYIVSSDGLVVTNKHVVSIICKNDADRIQITGLTHDQKAYNLTLKSIDPIDDLAILKIDSNGEKFQTISFGNSDTLKLGQDVVAIGNVLGELQNTVTKGIVSGLNRSFETEITDQCTGSNFQADNLVQTDAAINRGNSGGPLFNSSGQLIGMNTLGTVDAQNIGLAIPSATIRNILDAYSNNNSITRARLGLSSLQINSIRKAQNSWIPVDYGELVFRQEGSPVDINSAAGEAGIKEGDIILEYNGKKLVTTNTNPSPIRREVLNSQAGQKVQLTILKAISKTQSGFTYDQSPTTIDVILGSTFFDLKTKQVVAN